MIRRKFRYTGLVLLLYALFANNVLLCQQTEKSYISLWEGTLKAGAVSLRMFLKVFKNEDGSLSAHLDSPDQGIKNIPVDKVSISKDSLKLQSSSARFTYSGAFEKDGLSVKGKLMQSGNPLPLDFKKTEKFTQSNRPQTPKPPFPYNVEELTFENKTANIKLAGTLTYPMGDGKYPAVVMVTGSGPQDRDETIFEHKPFFVIADYLTRNGIAVLRVDDRGIGKSKGNFATATTADFATDARAAVEYLKTRKEIDPKKIGIIGHSEGGAIAPMVASGSNDVGFIVLLAGPGVRGDELLIKQTELVMKSGDGKKEDVEKAISINKKAYSVIVNEPDSSTAFKKLRQIYDEEISKLDDNEKKKEENSVHTFNALANTVLSPWFRFFLKYDPRPTLENVTVPVLALNGGNDIQVSPKENLSGIENALKNGGNKNYKVIELPGLNHLFQHCKACTVAEYGQLEETFSEEALKIIKDWILEVTK